MCLIDTVLKISLTPLKVYQQNGMGKRNRCACGNLKRRSSLQCLMCYRSSIQTRVEPTYINRRILNAYKMDLKCCAHCHITITKDTIQCFDMDHVDITTKSDSPRLMTTYATREQFLKELSLCQMLCCKCHLRKTTRERSVLNSKAFRKHKTSIGTSCNMTPERKMQHQASLAITIKDKLLKYLDLFPPSMKKKKRTSHKHAAPIRPESPLNLDSDSA